VGVGEYGLLILLMFFHTDFVRNHSCYLVGLKEYSYSNMYSCMSCMSLFIYISVQMSEARSEKERKVRKLKGPREVYKIDEMHLCGPVCLCA